MLHGTQIQSVQKTVNIKETRLGCQAFFPRLIQWNTERAIMIIIKGSATNKRASECEINFDVGKVLNIHCYITILISSE